VELNTLQGRDDDEAVLRALCSDTSFRSYFYDFFGRVSESDGFMRNGLLLKNTNQMPYVVLSRA
jgi:hypothetical protein